MIAQKVIEAKFKRSGIRPLKTYLWEDMQEDLKSDVQKKMQLNPDETCIICFFKSQEYILLLTTNRLVILERGHTNAILYASIEDVKLNEVFSGEQSKTENETINVFLKSKEIVDIKVEKGTWHILYSIIKLLSL